MTQGRPRMRSGIGQAFSPAQEVDPPGDRHLQAWTGLFALGSLDSDLDAWGPAVVWVRAFDNESVLSLLGCLPGPEA